MALIEVRDVTISRGDVPVIEGLSLAINEGTITAIIGANGWERALSLVRSPEITHLMLV